jgi:hypothetical protein
MGSTLLYRFGRILRLCSMPSLRLREAYTDAHLFETICQIRGDELDGAGTNELVHRILVSLNLTNMTLVPSPVQSSSSSPHLGSLAVPRNGNSSTLTKSRDYSRCMLSHPPGITVLRFQVRFVQRILHRPATHTFIPPVDWPMTYAQFDDALHRLVSLAGKVVRWYYRYSRPRTAQNEQSIYRGRVDRKVVLLCRQVDVIAAVCPTLLWRKV